MKLLILTCLFSAALGVPQFGSQGATHHRATPRFYQVLHDTRTDQGNGNFAYEFETENGIHQKVVGRPGSQGQSNIEGSYRFTLDDGTIAEVRYVADENGFRAESPLIPTLPAHAIKQIHFANQERARGVGFQQAVPQPQPFPTRRFPSSNFGINRRF